MLDYIWDAYDKNEDDYLSKDEAKEFIEGYLGVYSPSETEFNEKYNDIDTDRNGLISQLEMKIFIKSTCECTLKAQGH